jgi:hypothetical protein
MTKKEGATQNQNLRLILLLMGNLAGATTNAARMGDLITKMR